MHIIFDNAIFPDGNFPRDHRVLYDKWSESSVNPYGKNIGPVAGPVQIVLNYQKVHGGHHLCK